MEELGRGNHEQNILRGNFFSVENKRSNNTKKKKKKTRPYRSAYSLI